MNNELVKVEAQIAQAGSGAVAVQQSRAMAMQFAKLQAAIVRPRDVVRSLARIKNACMRPSLARVATYTYSRGGTDITGPSIRLAEVLAQNYGNIDCGIKEIEQRDGESTVLAYASDLETNFHCEKEFQVKHIIFKKQGGAKRLVDPRDIYEKIANDGSRRLRSCILAVIPKDVVDEAVETCEATLRADCGEITKDRIESMLAKLSEFDVTKEMIEKRIQRNLTSITPAQFIDLGKKYNALKEGIAKVEDFFEKVEKEEPKKEAKKTEKTMKDALGIGGESAAAQNAKPDEGKGGKPDEGEGGKPKSEEEDDPFKDK